MDVAVPATPEITPAVTSVARVLGTAASRMDRATTASTIAPTAIPSARSDITASTSWRSSHPRPGRCALRRLAAARLVPFAHVPGARYFGRAESFLRKVYLRQWHGPGAQPGGNKLRDTRVAPVLPVLKPRPPS